MMKTRRWQWQWWRQEDDNDNDEDKKMTMTMMKTRKCTKCTEIYIYIPSGIDNGAEVVDWMYLQTELFLAFQMERKLVELIELDVRHPCGSDSVHVWLDFLWGHILRQGEMAIALFMWHCTIFNERHIPCVAEIFYTFTLNISRKVEDNIFKIFFCWNISCRVELRFVGCFNKI